MNLGVICQSCGIEAPSKQVQFHQNIGALFMRFHKTRKGRLCKSCVHGYFWSMTLTTLAIGWLGLISLVLAPIFVINNIIQYFGALGMPAVPAGAQVPQIDQAQFNRFLPYTEQCFQRVQSGQDMSDVARDIGPRINLTPGQVVKCMIEVARQRAVAQQSARPTGGFPVIPVAQQSPLPPPPLPLSK